MYIKNISFFYRQPVQGNEHTLGKLPYSSSIHLHLANSLHTSLTSTSDTDTDVKENSQDSDLRGMLWTLVTRTPPPYTRAPRFSLYITVHRVHLYIKVCYIPPYIVVCGVPFYIRIQRVPHCTVKGNLADSDVKVKSEDTDLRRKGGTLVTTDHLLQSKYTNVRGWRLLI